MREMQTSETKPVFVDHLSFKNAKMMSAIDIENEMFEIMTELHRRAAGVLAAPTSARKH
jgi:hypothetical protein